MTQRADTARDDGPDDADRCPCGSGDVLGGCCGPLLHGTAAPTAERLMRSRYTAFALGAVDHLRATWHPSTRPATLEIDADLRWRRLAILERERGGPFDRDGVVEFVAQWEQAGERGRLHERSRFVREDRRWFYVDGDVR
ncbi:YchJ family protein [Microbacterium sp. 179-I 3D4 NHS]|uniref:YchJ family protein n=1 Tax=Microbacterium sp. 179-I 3D4 NHS TaxID=3142381 RepID=UPI0039A1FA7C